MDVLKIKTEELEDRPKCPHCYQELYEIYRYKVGNMFTGANLFACPECKNTLGVGPPNV